MIFRNRAPNLVALVEDILARAINIEEKINRLLPARDSNGVVARGGAFSGHPDQWYGGYTYSQHGEDLLIVNLFRRMGIEKPSYIDIGAHHPINISNTCLLYNRGSRGINVDANPNLIEAFRSIRPDDTNLNIGVSTCSGEMTFYMIDEFSGRNSFSESEIKLFLRENPSFKLRKTIQIEVTTLTEIIQRYAQGVFPDFLSIDVEGFDESILSTLEYEKGNVPKIICVETIDAAGGELSGIKKLLLGNGYYHVATMGGNSIFLLGEYSGKR